MKTAADEFADGGSGVFRGLAGIQGMLDDAQAWRRQAAKCQPRQPCVKSHGTNAATVIIRRTAKIPIYMLGCHQGHAGLGILGQYGLCTAEMKVCGLREFQSPTGYEQIPESIRAVDAVVAVKFGDQCRR
ncbi:hypothetical protein WV31_13205 [Magnetospirillum sp. ME-1]|nr:hypothetical protein WV31_13205 [Magnetospirillum sp. ME-1]